MNQRWHDSESTFRPRQIQGSELEDEFDQTRANGRSVINYSSLAVTKYQSDTTQFFQKVQNMTKSIKIFMKQDNNKNKKLLYREIDKTLEVGILTRVKILL